MIQRIQTVYLFMVAVMAATMFFLPLAVIQSGDDFYSFDVTGLTTLVGDSQELVYATWGLFALAAIISLVAFVTIFLYKHRMLQIRFSIFNALLMVGFYCLFFFYIWAFKGQGHMDAISVKLALSFPIIMLILDYLAIRNIGADEMLVRSLNRLR